MATSNPIAKFTYGNRYVKIDGTPYKLTPDFAPPATVIAAQTAGGTSANVYGGAEKVNERASNTTWTFTVHVYGDTEAEVTHHRQVLSAFLRQAGASKNTPLFFEWRGNSDIEAEPLWGQYGSNFRYEIVHAGVPVIDTLYGLGGLRGKRVTLSVNLEIKPFCQGNRQRLASATGGILLDTLGLPKGKNRGVIVPDATTNKMTNPIFSHATFNNDWTADASLIASENTDPDYVLFGLVSAKLQSKATTQEFYQTINVGNTNAHFISAYLKMYNGTTPSGAVLLFYNTGTVTTTFTSIGDGWYWARGAVTGVASGVAVGVRVTNGYTVYLGGMQIEESDYPTPLCHGMMLGCAWSGTAHASTTTRTAALLTVPFSNATLNMSAGMFRVCIQTLASSSSYGASTLTFLQGGIGNFTLSWEGGANTFAFTDGTNTATSAATSFGGSEKIIFHAVYGPSGLVLYKNGVSIATNATYTAPTIPADIYVGSTSVGGFHGNVAFMELAFYGDTPTAAEVLADATNLTQAAANDEVIAPIPWLWTKDGDDVVDNNNDAGEDNFCVVHGIAGDVPAITEWHATRSVSWGTAEYTMFGLADHDEFFDVGTTLFKDLDGTATTSADSGSAATTTSLSTVATLLASTSDTTPGQQLFGGKRIFPFIRMSDAGSNLRLATYISSGGTFIRSDFVNVTGNSARWLLESPSIVIPELGIIADSYSPAISVFIVGKRSTGTADVTVDYGMFLPSPMLIGPETNNTEVALYYHSGKKMARSGLDLQMRTPILIQGELIEFIPNKFNVLMSLIFNRRSTAVVTYTMTYNSVFITPRYSLA